jgi:signal transduction histidine kinase
VTPEKPSRLTLLTVALIVLLPALAILQFRWVGQLSDAERDRMQRNMRNDAAQFREAFDGEIGRAFMALQVDGAMVREESWQRYAERYAAWADTAAHPAVIAHVYLIDSDGARVRLRRWNATSHQFETAPWDGDLAALQSHFEQDLEAHRAGELVRRDPRPFRENESLLIAPLVSVQVGITGTRQHMPLVSVFGYTVLQLNMPFIREDLLRELAERHFTHTTHTDGAAYRVTVVDAADSRKVIYRSSADGPADVARADASELFFAAHGDPLMFLAHGALRQSSPNIRETRNLVVSVIREKRADAAGLRARIFESQVGRWRLLVQHERGSLEAAVAGVRQRNLIVSFGILLLMGVSIGLLTISSRRAQSLARQQMEFVAGVSHELRTPVAVIRSAADNLSHGVIEDPERVRRYGDAIQVEARRLGEMVERVLQFAGIESGRPIARSPVAIPQIIDEAVEAALASDGASTIERNVATDLPAVVGDAAALRSAVRNLLANAAKYGGHDRWIGIRAESSRRGRARQVSITIEDRGPGIAPTDLPHIFEPFYRGADVVARQIQGSGLGLALVRRIVEAHGGSVTVANRQGGGSAFTIHLPAAGADAAASFGEVGSIVDQSPVPNS